MKIICLAENTEGVSGCEAEHGLSLYIETKKHKLLLDTGASDLFAVNAEKLGIDLTAVDTVVLSHGHYDHSGGIMTFAAINPTAGITGRKYFSKSNLALTERTENGEIQDSFSHEQCLVISDGERKTLMSGCAHNGILNILDKYRKLFGSNPDTVITGFHMMKKTEYTDEETAIITDTAKELMKTDIRFYSGHCTGIPAFDMMKEIMGVRLTAIHSGDKVMEE